MKNKMASKHIVLLMIILSASVVLVSGCSQQEPAATTTTAGVTTTTSDIAVREISVTAKEFEFIPDPIEVNLGEKVRLRITSTDVAHGIRISEFGINERLEPGEEVIVEFVADQAGEFNVICNVFCGSGHSDMKGKLIVR